MLTLKRLPLSLVLLVLASSPAIATPQQADMLRYEEATYPIPQRPLNSLWWNDDEGLRIPRFDVNDSTNWKGYIAAWQVKDARLYLTEFDATRDGDPVPATDIPAGRNLPALADWFTGRIYIPTGEPIGAEGKNTRIVVLHIEKGVVVRKETKENSTLVSTWDGNPRPAKATGVEKSR